MPNCVGKVPLHLRLFFQVESNPYHYDSHVQLIKLLRECGDLDRVRNARESMSKIFPLTQGNICIAVFMNYL